MSRFYIILVLSLRNIARNKKRSLLAGFAISLGVAAVISTKSYTTGIFSNLIEELANYQLGHIKIVSNDYLKDERVNPLSKNIPQDLKIKEDSRIKHISPRINYGVMLYQNGKNKLSLCLAIKPEDGKDILNLDKKIIRGSYFNGTERGILLGKGLMKRLNLDIGQDFLVITQTAEGGLNALRFKILGELSFGLGNMDDNMFVMQLADAQRLLRMQDRVTEVLIYLKNPEDVTRVADALQMETRENLSIRTWKEQGDWFRLFQFAMAVYDIGYSIIIFLSCFVIINTMIMIVFERKKEIGIIRAMGLTSLEILLLLFFEGVIIGTLGSIGGAVLGGVETWLVGSIGINIESASSSVSVPISTVIYPVLELKSFYVALIMGFLISCIANLIPARMASRLNVVDSIRG